MAEQEPNRAAHQAQSQDQNLPQNEGQGSASGSRGSSRGGRRRGRGGRSRGQRQGGSAQGPGGRGNTFQTESADASIATAPAPAPTEPAASDAPESSGNSRNRRNRRGNRGGARGSADQSRGVFTMGPRRQFGGRLTTNEQLSDAEAQDASLRANAPEFVPGQQAPGTGEPQPAAQPRSRGNRTRNRRQDRPRQEVPKSTAPELWQRIQEDIANWNYECRICTEEVTRKTEVWSCGTCWTVVHLECAHQWWETSMKVNEESGDKSWRCPGCNSTLTDEPGDNSCCLDQRAPIHALFSVTLGLAHLALFSAHQSRAIAESTPSERIVETQTTTTDGAAESCVVISFHARNTNALRYAIQACAVLVKQPCRRNATVDELRRTCNAQSRMICAIHMITRTTLGLRVLSSARTIAEEHMTATLIVASCLVTHKMNCQLIVLSPQTSSPTVLVERRHSRSSWIVLASPATTPFPIVKGSARRNWIAVISVSYCVILGTATLAWKSWKSIVDVVESHLRRCVTELKFNNLCASRPARQTGTVDDTDVASIAAQLCGKPKPLCGHPCQSVCHGQTACNESTACQVKMTVKCACGNHKKEFKCLASTSNATPNRPEVRCDEECERLDRNRRLAAALNIDPATHTNDHVPFSDDTLKLYKQFPKWGDEQESQFRVFAANKDEVRLRYEPMKNISRQFLHLLAEDFGLESKSEDHDIHRSVLVWKTDKFVAAPPKTLSQCVKIRAAQAAEAAAAAAIRPPSPPVLETEPFNALVLTEPRFGLTNDDVNTALASDLSSLQGFSFKVDFLGEEVLIKATVAYSAFLTPAPLEKSLEVLKPRIEQTIHREKLAENVLLCHSDVNGAITRREVPRRAGAGGWSAVAGRAASKPGSSSTVEEAKPGRRLLLGLKKKKPQPEAGKVWAALDGDVEC
ncbi:hypothetical protein FLONG3_10099 [Fusarium longipes]|uniref:R3H domain-containing protein n=1 Tax=Fusarium longipes TaxID=694270 RepID=A0A395RRX7_9HYPO|nr:hypothetical protein FLONG3_10099 [Fusarium longipes]